MRPLAKPFGGCSLQQMTTFENVASQCRRSWRAICTIAVLGMLTACSSTTSDKCVVALSDKISCPASFENALVSDPCSATGQNSDTPMSGECDGFLVYSSGHDGRTTCYYDPSTHALIGATLCGIPPFYSPSCTCTNAGASPSSCPAGSLTALCSRDGGSAADH